MVEPAPALRHLATRGEPGKPYTRSLDMREWQRRRTAVKTRPPCIRAPFRPAPVRILRERNPGKRFTLYVHLLSSVPKKSTRSKGCLSLVPIHSFLPYWNPSYSHVCIYILSVLPLLARPDLHRWCRGQKESRWKMTRNSTVRTEEKVDAMWKGACSRGSREVWWVTVIAFQWKKSTEYRGISVADGEAKECK